MTRQVADGYEPVLKAAQGLAAQVAAYVDGVPVVDIGDERMRSVYSTTKGILGAAIALLVERGELDLELPVAAVWPEFGRAGKSDVTVRQAMSHQAGVPAVDGALTEEDLLDHDRLATRVADQAPWWPVGRGYAYHAITIGTIGEELVRRVTGGSIAALFIQELGGGHELFLGSDIPPTAVPVEPPTIEEVSAVMQALGVTAPGPLAERAAVQGGPTTFTFVQSPPFRATGQSATAAVGSARGLAAFYASLPSILSFSTLAQVAMEQVRGKDLISGRDAAYGVVFEVPSPVFGFGGPGSFGHGGMGGSVAFLDGSLAFGFVPYRFPDPGMLNQLAAVVRAVRSCARLEGAAS